VTTLVRTHSAEFAGDGDFVSGSPGVGGVTRTGKPRQIRGRRSGLLYAFTSVGAIFPTERGMKTERCWRCEEPIVQSESQVRSPLGRVHLDCYTSWFMARYGVAPRLVAGPESEPNVYRSAQRGPV